jgi:hypothetical protein
MKKLKLEGAVEVGDVLLLSNGRLARMASEIKLDPSGNYFMLQFVHERGETFQDDDGTLDIERNLGQTDEVLTTFYAARGIHERLNGLKIST